MVAVAFCIVGRMSPVPATPSFAQHELRDVPAEHGDADESSESAVTQSGGHAGKGPVVIDPQPIRAEHVPGTVLVGIADGVTVDQVNERLAQLDYVATKQVSEDDVMFGFVKLDLAADIAVEDAVAQLEAADFTSATQPDYVYHLLDDTETDAAALQAATAQGGFATQAAAINDPRQSDQWALDAIHAYEAWDYAKTSNTVTVAVLDTGVNTAHEDLSANIVAPHNALNGSANVTDENGHGTHVSGIVGAVANNGKGVAGVSYNANVMPIKISSDGTTTTSTIAAGASYVAQYAKAHPEANVRVLNLSFGAEYELGEVDSTCANAMAALNQSGILVVCSAGNYADLHPHNENGTAYEDGADHPYRCAPVDYDSSIVGVVNVAKSVEEGVTTYDRAKGSNFNMGSYRTKDLSAPGTAIYSTLAGGGYGAMSGTSMAAPCVAGVAALVFAVDPGLEPSRVQAILHETATDINAEGFDAETGYGMVNAAAAVRAAGAPAVSGANVLAKGHEAQLSVSYAFGAPTWTWSSSNDSVATVSQDGVVTGKGAGTATITAQSGALSATCEVGVYDPAISGEDTVEYGSSITLSVSPDNPANAQWRWSTKGSTVAVGSSTGLVAGLALGSSDVEVALNTPEVEGAADSKTVTVVPANLSKATMSGVEDQLYAGTDTKLPNLKVTMPGYVRYYGNTYTKATVTLVEGTDYDVVYDLGSADGTATTTATVTVKGKGNYTGEISGEFKVGANTIGDSQVSASKVRYTYTGKPIVLEDLVVKSADGAELVEGQDYRADYSDNVDVGNGYGYVTIVGINNYVGEVTRSFYIDAVNITSDAVVLDQGSIVDKTYTGAIATQSPKLTYNGMTLVQGTDFTVRYMSGTTGGKTYSPIDAGPAMIRIEGLGNYETGTYFMGIKLASDYLTATYTINPASLEDAVVTAADQTYSGNELAPVPTVKLGDNNLATSDYEVVGYADNVNVGTAQVTVKAKSGNLVEGTTATGRFAINPAPIASVELEQASYVCDGTQKNPRVTVRGANGLELAQGTDYALDVPAGRTDAGLYTYTATGKGNYAGTAEATLTITAPPEPDDGGSGSGGDSGGGSGGNEPDGLAAYAGTARSSGLSDLDSAKWYMRVGEGLGSFPGTSTLYLDYTLKEGLMSGYRDEDGVIRRFGPDDYLNRAQAATILYRLANPNATDTTNPAEYASNESGLPDVESGAYYTAAVNWCVREGVITGYGQPGAYYAFGPTDLVLREQIATMIARYCTAHEDKPAASTDISRFSDYPSISGYAQSGVSYCVACGIMGGYSGTDAFGPKDHTTRCQMSKIIAVTATAL